MADSPERPRLLALAQCYPYPPQSGVTIRTFNILQQLQREFDVSLLAFSRANHQGTAEARAQAHQGLQAHLSSAAPPVPIPAEQHSAWRVWDHMLSLIQRRPYVYHEYRASAFRRLLRRTLKVVRPDLIHLDSLDLYGWLLDLPPVPVACTHHSVESALMRQQAEHLPHRPVRAYVRYQARLLEEIECALCPRLALNVMMSELDAGRLQALAPGTETFVSPNGVDLDFFERVRSASQVPGRVLFVGPAFNFPNRDAVEWLLSAIWPGVLRSRAGASLMLVGGGPPGLLNGYAAHQGVTVAGRVPDIRKPLGEASCCVVPIRTGGGTRLKILDAWASGRAVVSTTVGCEGLDVVDGENILIRDDPADLAAAVIRVLDDRDLRGRLEAGGRRTVEEAYDWEVIGERLRQRYRMLMERPAPRTLQGTPDR